MDSCYCCGGIYDKMAECECCCEALVCDKCMNKCTSCGFEHVCVNCSTKCTECNETNCSVCVFGNDVCEDCYFESPVKPKRSFK